MGSTIIGSGQNMLLVASEVDMMMMTRRLRNVRAIQSQGGNVPQNHLGRLGKNRDHEQVQREKRRQRMRRRLIRPLKTYIGSLYGLSKGFKRSKMPIMSQGMPHFFQRSFYPSLSTPKFKLLSLNKYDRNTDFKIHLAIFQTTIQLLNVNDFMLGRVSLSTLIGLE